MNDSLIPEIWDAETNVALRFLENIKSKQRPAVIAPRNGLRTKATIVTWASLN